MYNFIAFVNGILFGTGLTVSNMINPNKILNFLDVTGNWDPTLLVVMAAALVTTFIGYRFVNSMKKPVFDECFYLPENTQITAKLIIGSAIFGIGWGISGYCPGPSISALATWNIDPVYFVIGMIAGSFAYYRFSVRKK